jgi:hypothetical protein
VRYSKSLRAVITARAVTLTDEASASDFLIGKFTLPHRSNLSMHPANMCRTFLHHAGWLSTVASLFLLGCSGNSGFQPPTVAVGTPPGVTQLSSDVPEIPGAPPAMAPLPTLAMGSAPPAPSVSIRSGTYTGIAWPMGSGGGPCADSPGISGFHVRGHTVQYGPLRGTIDTQKGVQMTNGQTWIYGQFEGEAFAGQMDVLGPGGGAGCTYLMNSPA